MFIKICGITNAEAIRAAIDCEVDAIGFVFAPSTRRLAPAQAAQLVASVPRSLLRVAVTQHPTQAELDVIIEQVKPDIVQTDLQDVAGLNIPATVELLPVLRGSCATHLPHRVLFEGPVSGRGETGDWTRAEQLARQSQLILAGGLHAGNVAAAIERVRPFGVDVSSGVERAPGVKDRKRMVEFVAAVRSAVAALETVR